jgi:DNA polymerase-3 subunit delta
MVALKPRDFDRLVADPARAPAVVLVFGPEQGLVAERAKALVDAANRGASDPFSLVRLDGAEVASDPGRLSDEARTIALFGGRRIIWVRDAGTRAIEPALAPLLDAPPQDALVVVEAGDLKKGTGLRKRIEDHATAAALACYADEAADIERIIDEIARRDGLEVEADARAALKDLLGADRRQTRAEIEKLALYAHGTGTVRLADVEAVIGDTAAETLDSTIDAALTGAVADLDRTLSRLLRAGTSAPAILSAALRQVHALARGRLLVEEGAAPAAAVERMVPPVFFRRKQVVADALGLWSLADLDTAAARIEEAIVGTRRTAALSDEITGTLLMTLASAARARRARRRAAGR